MLAHNVQVSHADLAAQVTQQSGIGQVMAVVGSDAGMAIAMLDAEVNRQALMIAYLDDYKLMMLLTLAAVPLLLFVRRPPNSGGGGGLL